MALKPVPEGNKGLKKLPTEVRNKMGFMAKGGRVIGKNISDSDRARVSKMMGKEKLDPEVSGLLSQMSLKESGKGISDADRSRVSKMMGKSKVAMRKPRGMKKGGEVDPTKFTGTLKGNFKRLAGNAIQSLHNMTFPKEEREKLQKIQKDDLDKYYLDKEKKRKKRKAGKEMKKTVLQVIGKKQGGLVKGGTSSQMTGKEFKGIF
jgi:hypothetical protein